MTGTLAVLAAASMLFPGAGRAPLPLPAGDGDVRHARDLLAGPVAGTRHRVWILFDSSRSMRQGAPPRYEIARQAVRDLMASLRSDSGEPLAHWGYAQFDGSSSRNGVHQSRGRCSDPSFGSGLHPTGIVSPPTVSSRLVCAGVDRRFVAPGCDRERSAREVLRALERRFAGSETTPAGIALLQLSLWIQENQLADLEPGQKNIILFLTDGLDTCECSDGTWADFNVGSPGDGKFWLALRTDGRTDALSYYFDTQDEWEGAAQTYNAGLKAKAAIRALNGGDPSAGIGDILVVGVGMEHPGLRRRTNHLAWEASNLRRPAFYPTALDTLHETLLAALDDVLLSGRRTRLAPPRLAAVKELAAVAPGAGDSGPPSSLRDLVADPDDPAGFEAALRRRSGLRDNVLFSTSAALGEARGSLQAFASAPAGGAGAPLWDAGALLASRSPGDRVILFNRPGGTELRPFTTAEVAPADLGVAAGYLSELDGVGAKTAADAAEIVVRVIRGEGLEIHGDTAGLYGPDGGLNFVGGAGTWKLRESFASPVVVSQPPARHPGVGERAAAYETFFRERANRGTVVYLPTSGGLLHAFSGGDGAELFAYVPSDLLGPPTGGDGDDDGGRRRFLRDIVRDQVVSGPGSARRPVLTEAPVVRDAFVSGAFRTVLAFGRGRRGRFVTALDVTGVGGDWDGSPGTGRVRPGGPGAPRLLWSVGPDGESGVLAGFGETPSPLLVDVPGRDGPEWVALQSGGVGSDGDDSGEWLHVLSLADGSLLRRYRAPAAPDAVLPKNGLPAPPAAWRPAWGLSGATDATTRIYVGDVHGQVHRLNVETPGAWDWEIVHRLGGGSPIASRIVAFPFPGRTEPHLLVVSGGHRDVPDAGTRLLLLRDVGDVLVNVWEQGLDAGEIIHGAPTVVTDGTGVRVVLATEAETVARTTRAGCYGGETPAVTEARLRILDGLTGDWTPATGSGGTPDTGQGSDDAGDAPTPYLALGSGALRGVTLSSTGNLAGSLTGVGGEAVDVLIGDFEFGIPDGALEGVSIFIESFRRSPF